MPPVVMAEIAAPVAQHRSTRVVPPSLLPAEPRQNEGDKERLLVAAAVLAQLASGSGEEACG